MESLGRLNITTVELSDLNPAPYNPRTIDDVSKAGLTSSLSEFGLVEPIVLNCRTGNIVGGHQRYYILKEKGVKETDVVVVDLDEKKEKALNIALNHQSIAGKYDEDKLQELLEEVKLDDAKLFEELLFKDLELPTWEPLPDVEKSLPLDAAYTTIKVRIPKEKDYLKGEIVDHINAAIQEHWPEHEIKIE